MSKPVKTELYLSGPVTTRPANSVDSFRRAAEKLRSMNYVVFNPLEIDVETQDDDTAPAFKDYMLPQISALLETKKAVIVLPGWQDDVGARLEVAVASAIGLIVREFDAEEGLGTIIYTSNAGRDAVAQMVGGRNPVDPFFDESDERPHEEAARIVLGPRGEFYDHPYDNFTRTAYVWTGILYSKLLPNTILTPEDVALCMNGVKIAREAFRHRRDNLTDGHGYWMTLEMVLEERQRRNDKT